MDGVNGSFSPGSSRVSREDCWSEEATFTLIESWGSRYIDLNRGNLRQKHWQEVANAVNNRHFNTGRNVSAAKSQPYRTDVQCKNRIDTLKKKYKVEKARAPEFSHWPFYSVLNDLIGDNNTENNSERSPLPITVPVAPRSATTRRPNELLGFRGDLNAFAAAAAAAACPASEDESEGWRCRGRRKREREGGYKEVAEAIERLGEIYERVEERKRKEMVELEKQRMSFAKELECHRMHLFTQMHLRLHKLTRGNASAKAGISY